MNDGGIIMALAGVWLFIMTKNVPASIAMILYGTALAILPIQKGEKGSSQRRKNGQKSQ